MTETTAHQALRAWGLGGAGLCLVAQRENTVYRVQSGAARYALRLHRPGYQSAATILSELAWMAHLGQAGLTVPRPVPSQSGRLLEEVGGYQIDLLTWLDGRPMGATGAPLDLADRTGTFRGIGALMAQLHSISDAWTPPEGFVRQAWDLEGLLGDTPLWGRFWDNPGLDTGARARVLRARDELRTDLAGGTLDFGLIHADMLRENVMMGADRLGLIDFDDSGFGFRLFDVATALIKNRTEPDYPDLEAAFLEGYRAHRALDTGMLAQVMLIRALSYLGWIIPRMAEPGAQLRQKRFLSTALPMVEDYLGQRD